MIKADNLTSIFFLMGDGLLKVQRMGTSPFHSPKVSAHKKLSGTDYSDRDHITVKYCFWNTRLFKKHSYSVSELPDGLFCSRSQRTTTR